MEPDPRDGGAGRSGGALRATVCWLIGLPWWCLVAGRGRQRCIGYGLNKLDHSTANIATAITNRLPQKALRANFAFGLAGVLGVVLALAFFLPLFGLLGFGILINLVEGLLRFHLWLRLEVFLDDARQMLRHLVILNK